MAATDSFAKAPHVDESIQQWASNLSNFPPVNATPAAPTSPVPANGLEEAFGLAAPAAASVAPAAASVAPAAVSVAPQGPLRNNSRVADAITNARARSITAGPLTSQEEREAGEGKLKRAMRSVRGRFSAKSLKDAKARLGKAAKATRRLLVTGNYAGEIIVAGERVRLDERNFNPDKFYDVVSFHQKFFPSRAVATDLEKEKAVFSRVFGDGAPIDPETKAPSLPCSPEESSLLLEGLKHRFELLRNDTVLLYEQVGDTTDVRARIDHAQRLKIFINVLERAKQEGTCIDFQDLSKVTSRDVQTEEEIRQLLRQFAFMILQARAPVPEYADKTRIVQDFIEELQRDPISEDEMNAYLVLWREQAAAKGDPAAMPAVLGEVLDTTSTQKGLLDMMVEDRLDDLYLKLLAAVRADYSVQGVDPSLLEELNRFVLEEISQKAADLSPQEKVVAVVKKVVQMNLKCWKDYQQAEAQIVSLAAQKDGLTRDLAEAMTKLEAAALQKEAVAKQVEELQQQVTGLEAEKAGLRVELEGKQRALEEQTASAERDAERLNTTINDLGSRIAMIEGELAVARKGQEEAEAKAIAALSAQDELQALLEGERDQHEKLKAGYAALQEKYNALDARIKEADKELNETRAELLGAQAEVKQLTEGVSVSAAAAAEKDGQLAELTQQVAGLTAAAATLEGEKGELQKRLNECGKAMEEERAKFRALTEEKIAAEAKAAEDVGAARAETAEAGVKLRSVQAAAALSAAQIQQNINRIRQLNEEIAKARGDLDTATKEVAAMQVAVTAGEEDKRIALASAEQAQAALQASLEKLTKDCEEAKERAAAAIADRDGQIEQLNRRLSEAMAEQAALAAKVAEAEAAVVEKKNEMLAAAAAAASGLALSKEEGEAAAIKLREDLAALQTAKEEAEKRLAEVATEKGKIEEELEASKKAAVAATGHASQLQGELNKFQTDAVKQLQELAQNVLDGRMQVPGGTPTALGAGFQSLLNNIRQANEKAAAEGFASGAVANPDAKFNVSTQICFMTHFITFFVKTLFFTQDKLSEKRYDLYQRLNEYVDKAVASHKEAHEEEKDDKFILYQMLSAAFSLLYAGDTLYMNKQTLRETEYPAEKFIGLQVLKQNGPDGAPDFLRVELVKRLWDTWQGYSSLKKPLNTVVQSVFGQILLLVPKVHFNPPIPINHGQKLDVLELLYTYPSMTFLTSDTVMSSTLYSKITEVDVDNGFTMKSHSIPDEIPTDARGAKLAEMTWPIAVREVMYNETLSFADLFCIFIVLGRKYLLTIRGDLQRFKCPLPSFLADEGALAKAGLTADKTAYNTRMQGEAAAEAERQRKAQEEAEAKRKAEEDARRKAQEEAEAKRKAEEDARRKAQEEAEAKRKAEEEEAEQKRLEQIAREAEAERQREAAEKETQRKAREDEEARRQAQEDAERVAREVAEESRRIQEENARRKAQEEADAKRKAEEEEAKRKAEEEAKAKAQAASRPSSAIGYSERPTTAGGKGVISNAETITAIIKQVTAGSGKKPIINEFIRKDLEKYAENSQKSVFPILEFINTYSIYSEYFRGAKIVTLPSNEVSAVEQNKKFMERFIKNVNAKPVGNDSVNFVRKFMFEFFDTYTRQYRISTNEQPPRLAETVAQKAVLLFPEFAKNFDITIPGKGGLFTILGINLASLLQYCNQVPPKQFTPKTGRASDLRFIGSETFRGGGEDDDTGDSESEFSGEE